SSDSYWPPLAARMNSLLWCSTRLTAASARPAPNGSNHAQVSTAKGQKSSRKGTRRHGDAATRGRENQEIRVQRHLSPRRPVAAEAMRPQPAEAINETSRTLSHKDAQAMLVEIGTMLGRHAEAEFDYYDVVWRDSSNSPRLSHVFEVQIAGSVDSALTRLKHAYDAQRSRPFLIVADERSARFAGKRLTGSFHEIWEVITVIGVGDLQRLYEALKSQQAWL